MARMKGNLWGFRDLGRADLASLGCRGFGGFGVWGVVGRSRFTYRVSRFRGFRVGGP